MIRINRLIILSGPPAVGKSHFIQQVKKGRLAGIRSELDLNDLAKVVFARAQTLRDARHETADTLVLHYDFLGPFINGQHDYDDAPALSIVSSANEVTFVTMWVPAAVLANRIFKRRLRETVAFFPKLLLGKEGGTQQIHKLRRFKSIQNLYDDPYRLDQQYKKWLSFCDQHARSEHRLLINVKNQERLAHISDWDAMTRRPLGWASNGVSTSFAG